MQQNDPIEVYDRYSGQVIQEPVYGERWLRWTYQTRPGRVLLNLVIKHPWFSKWYGWRMSRPSSRARIRPFVERYGLDASEFALPIEAYASFNAFFSRRLKPGARPIDPDPDTVVFPADGRHLGLADYTEARTIYVKGQHVSFRKLFADGELERHFTHGTVVISRLCPLDYHRFHFPAAGVAGAPREVPGPLFSVNPIALRRHIEYLWENKHVVSVLETKRFGRVAIVEIGATCVGTIVQTAAPGPVEKGQEKGFFRFGGSCVVTVFEPGRVRLSDDLLE
ncbi:MAG: phosphatidylserine decarboxylase, partial [Verrucomicrobia bacterium]